MKNKLYIISFILTFIGGSIFGICIVLSEILYPNIDEFVNTPFEYQICFFISIFIAFVGIIMSIFFRNKANTKIIERIIEIPLLFIGSFLMFGFALARTESYFKDVLICIGGFLFFVSLFCIISTEIGLHKNYKIKNKIQTIEEILNKTDVNDFAVSIFFYLVEKSNKYTLTKEEKTVLIVRTFVEEVYNGGFEQFIYYSSDCHLDELLESFELIKANKLIEIYKDLIDKFLIYSSYCEKDYDKIIENNITEIRQCDLKLYEIEGSYFDEIIYDYVMKNKDKFN